MDERKVEYQVAEGRVESDKNGEFRRRKRVWIHTRFEVPIGRRGGVFW
jgi:hypothetical protein